MVGWKNSDNFLFPSADGLNIKEAKQRVGVLVQTFRTEKQERINEAETRLRFINAESFDKQLTLELKETILLNFSNNIKCGNSLVGMDIKGLGDNLSLEEELRIRPFDWETAFPDVMKSGGFDAIVGNPPYVKIQMLQDTNLTMVDWFKRKYNSASTGNYDIYVVFVERAIQLLKNNGRLGYILPHKFFNQGYGKNLRELLGNRKERKAPSERNVKQFTNNLKIK